MAKHLSIVLSLERTASQAMRNTLTRVRPAGTVFRSLHLYSDRWLPQKVDALPIEERQRLKLKTERFLALERSVRTAIFAADAQRSVFTARRDPVDRFRSAMWRKGHHLLREDPEAIFQKDLLRRALVHLDKERLYGTLSYGPIGLPANPKPGRHWSPLGFYIYVLNWPTLDDDFAAATEHAFGQPIPLARENEGAPEGYAEFKLRFDDADIYRRCLTIYENSPWCGRERRDSDLDAIAAQIDGVPRLADAVPPPRTGDDGELAARNRDMLTTAR